MTAHSMLSSGKSHNHTVHSTLLPTLFLCLLYFPQAGTRTPNCNPQRRSECAYENPRSWGEGGLVAFSLLVISVFWLFIPSPPPTHPPSSSSSQLQDISYTGDLNVFDQMMPWIHEQCIPLVREITFANGEVGGSLASFPGSPSHVAWE